jgi:hypothetical protein
VLAAWASTSSGAATAAAAVPDPPYRDSGVAGSITLCDASGRAIDHGRVDERPFARLAIGSAAAPAPYDKEGRTATLFAYQPRKGLEPREWSGAQLTTSTQYAEVAHPAAKASDGDDSLGDFLDTYPLRWDGFVQLRLYLSAPDEPAYTGRYAAADIHVDLDAGTWDVDHAANDVCAAGAGASSLEDRVIIPTTVDADPSRATRSAGSGASTDVRGAVPVAEHDNPLVKVVVGAVFSSILIGIVVFMKWQRR